MWLGSEAQFESTEPGHYELTTPTLAPFCLAIHCDGMRFAWPLPSHIGAVEGLLLAEAGSMRRVDRLMEFWLRQAGQAAEPDEEDLEGDALSSAGAPAADGEDVPIGSWRLNRLLLGVRRRFAQPKPGLPRPEGLLSAVRVRELLAVMEGLSEPDRLYFGTLLRAMLLGYWARDGGGRATWQAAQEADIVEAWSREASWVEFERTLLAAESHATMEAAKRRSESDPPGIEIAGRSAGGC